MVYLNYRYFKHPNGDDMCFIGEGTDEKPNGGLVRVINALGTIFEGCMTHDAKREGWGVVYYNSNCLRIAFY